MKRILIALSGVILLSLVVILFVNSRSNKKEETKAATELKAEGAKCSTTGTCTKHAEAMGIAAENTKECCKEKACAEACAKKECCKESGKTEGEGKACCAEKAAESK